ncbi:protein SNOWY COTYLEDON 3 isoform X2 [Capsella rubella]|uniref:protein SNOWY COTYLEDON 3 isoform X2 n=1 Tax=Capsella rubella TaxID=81985 RepID=UPI000CD57798|nr:protein SNOWY COTYLEDON 3 isoform X2 [Capsella rubella]
MVAAVPLAAISTTDPYKNPPRDRQDKPQLSSNNGGLQRRPRPAKNVPSRYLSPSPSRPHSHSTPTTTSSSSSSSAVAVLRSSKRYPSPLLSRTTNSASDFVKTPSSLLKRSQSADRRPPSAVSDTGTEMSAATKMHITSTRSLSVSFQGEAFSLPISKKKETTAPVSHRKSTPDRRRCTPVRDQRENSKPVDQQLWPGASRRGISEPVVPNSLSTSVDCDSDDGRKLGSGFAGRSTLQHSQSSRVSVDGRLDLRRGDDILEMRDESKTRPSTHPQLGSSVSCDFTASDTDSVSSGSTNGAQECGSGVHGEVSKTRSLSRNAMGSAKFWQETNSRLRRLQDPGSPRCSSPSSRISSISSKFSQSKRFSSDSPLASSPRGMSSPVRGATRPASPSKLWATTTSSSARAPSPSRARNGVSEQMNAYNRTLPSILCFSADIRRGKIGEDRVMDAHLLRLLYNRYLQWRFANARADSTFMVHRLSAEVGYLEEWSLLDRDHSNSLLGATESLKASTLRLPISGKALVDIQDLKHAVSSAVDVMHAMVSSLFSLTLKVEDMNSVMAEMVNVTAKEKVLVEQCQGLLSKVAAMQVTDCSMKTHIIQLSRI